MIEKGTGIRVLYPEYAAGLKGVVADREKQGRWIVKLENIALTNKKETLFLSLDESDFEVIGNNKKSVGDDKA